MPIMGGLKVALCPPTGSLLPAQPWSRSHPSPAGLGDSDAAHDHWQVRPGRESESIIMPLAVMMTVFKPCHHDEPESCQSLPRLPLLPLARPGKDSLALPPRPVAGSAGSKFSLLRRRGPGRIPPAILPSPGHCPGPENHDSAESPSPSTSASLSLVALLAGAVPRGNRDTIFRARGY